MNKKILNACILLFLTVSFSCKTSENEETTKVNASKDDLVGTWQWVKVLNTETNQEMSISELEDIDAEDIKTQFKDSNNYFEYKKNEDDTDYNVHKGDWKIEDGNMLSTKSTEGWKTSKIIKLSADTMYLQIQEPVAIIMAKEPI